MSWDDWTRTPWPEQRALLAGLTEDKEVPFEFQEQVTGDGGPPGWLKPQIQHVSDTVIDIDAMRAELEADRAEQIRRRKGLAAVPGQESGES
jgi:hypothetical protein